MDELKEYYDTVFNKNRYMPSFDTLDERQIKVIENSIGFTSWKFNLAWENFKSDLKNSKLYKWVVQKIK